MVIRKKRKKEKEKKANREERKKQKGEYLSSRYNIARHNTSEDSLGFSVLLGALFHLKSELNLTERSTYCCVDSTGQCDTNYYIFELKSTC